MTRIEEPCDKAATRSPFTKRSQRRDMGIPTAGRPANEDGRLPGHVAGGRVSCQRLSSPRHDRQRLGVDHRLVRAEASEGSGQGLLCTAQSKGTTSRRQLRSIAATRPRATSGFAASSAFQERGRRSSPWKADSPVRELHLRFRTAEHCSTPQVRQISDNRLQGEST
jgi:hypothetical protein